MPILVLHRSVRKSSSSRTARASRRPRPSTSWHASAWASRMRPPSPPALLSLPPCAREPAGRATHMVWLIRKIRSRFKSSRSSLNLPRTNSQKRKTSSIRQSPTLRMLRRSSRPQARTARTPAPMPRALPRRAMRPRRPPRPPVAQRSSTSISPRALPTPRGAEHLRRRATLGAILATARAKTTL